MRSQFHIIVLLVCIVCAAGCIKNQDSSQISATLETQSPHQTETHPNNISRPTEDQENMITMNTGNVTAIPTIIEPIQSIEPVLTVTTMQPVLSSTPALPVSTIRPDPIVVFRDATLLSLDDLQTKKNAVLSSYRSGKIIELKEQADLYENALRRNSILPKVPTKMDYVKVSYYDYVDRASQSAQSFHNGADRWIANDKSSANAYFDAGIIASDRADIAEKRIRTFFKNYVTQVQTNLT